MEYIEVMPEGSPTDRWFAVKVWHEWLPPVNGAGHMELSIYLIRAADEDEARRRAWAKAVAHEDVEITFRGQPVAAHLRGIDQIFDTQRSSLEEFEAEPLLFSHRFPVRDQWIDLYDPSR